MDLRYLLIGGMLLSFCGCGNTASDGPQRRIVEGMVSYQGKPLEHGMIRFNPQPDGPIVTAIIEKGHYRAENKGGVPLGQVRVEITATAGTTNASEEQILSGASPSVPEIPEQYNTSSTLVESVTEGRGPQQLNFELTKQ